MTVTITAGLVSAQSPPPVQVVLDGIPSGQAFEVFGVSQGGGMWAVAGGVGGYPGGQLVLVDKWSATNVPIWYRVETGGVAYETPNLTVPAPPNLLQSLNGDVRVDFAWLPNRLPLDLDSNVATYAVPGRPRPPARTAPGGDGGGELKIRTSAGQSERLRALLSLGEVVVLRTSDTGGLDLPPSGLLLITRATSQLSFDVRDVEHARTWTLAYTWADNPRPGASLSAWSWDDFDAAMADRTWDDFDALFALSSWDDFDTYPWGQL